MSTQSFPLQLLRQSADQVEGNAHRSADRDLDEGDADQEKESAVQVEANGDQVEGNTETRHLLEPPEESGTMDSRRVQNWEDWIKNWKDWPWKNIFITVTSLLGYLFLYTGISMIAPFYPIVVSFHHLPIRFYSKRPSSGGRGKGLVK